MADRGGFRGRGRRMDKSWVKLPGINLAMTAAGSSLGSNFGFTEARTILRMIGEYTISPTTAPSALDSCLITIGIGIMSSDAITAGSGSVVDPSAEAEYPWLYWKGHSFVFGSSSADPSSESGSVRVDFDIRSQRKVKPREGLMIVAEYSDIVGTPPLTFSFAGARVLLAE